MCCWLYYVEVMLRWFVFCLCVFDVWRVCVLLLLFFVVVVVVVGCAFALLYHVALCCVFKCSSLLLVVLFVLSLWLLFCFAFLKGC